MDGWEGRNEREGRRQERKDRERGRNKKRVSTNFRYFRSSYKFVID